jgi:hypothetical protein
MKLTLFVIGRWEDITRYCNLHTDRGTETERYSVCYEDGGKILQFTVNCTQTVEMQMNVTLFDMRTVGG